MTLTPNRTLAVILLSACAARGQLAHRWLAEATRTAPQKPVKPGEKPAKEQVNVDAKKIKGPKRNGKGGREFPVMFDIAGKAKAAKSKHTHAPKR